MYLQIVDMNKVISEFSGYMCDPETGIRSHKFEAFQDAVTKYQEEHKNNPDKTLDLDIIKAYTAAIKQDLKGGTLTKIQNVINDYFHMFYHLYNFQNNIVS